MAMVASTRVESPGRFLKKVPTGSYVHVEALPGSRNAAKSAVSRAAARGDLVPLRRGLYYKGTRTRYGVATPPPEDVALEVLGRKGVGPTGVSAARALNLTTQVPAMPELVTTGPVPIGIPGVRIHKRNNVSRRDLTYSEIAVLEVLRDWEFTSESGWAGVVRAVRDKVAGNEVRLTSLLEAGGRERGTDFKDRLHKLTAALVNAEPPSAAQPPGLGSA